MQSLFEQIIEQPDIHAKWLNTLSLMENTGAKKIKKCEHPIFVSETILKHAAEEARHAYFLKKQIKKMAKNACPTYERKYLLAPKSSLTYLHRLDIQVSRYLKENYDFTIDKLKFAAYLLVTYAIEVRADALYPVYQAALTQKNCPVSVRNIIVEEEQHLAEMNKQLDELFEDAEKNRTAVCAMEGLLFDTWIKEVKNEVNEYSLSLVE